MVSISSLNRPANPEGGSPGPSGISRRLPKRIRRNISFLSVNHNYRRNPYTASQEAISLGFPKTCDPLEDPNSCSSYSTRHRCKLQSQLEGCSAFSGSEEEEVEETREPSRTTTQQVHGSEFLCPEARPAAQPTPGHPHPPSTPESTEVETQVDDANRRLYHGATSTSK